MSTYKSATVCIDCHATSVEGPDPEGFIDCLECGAAWIPGVALAHPTPLPIHRTEAGYPRCSTCDGGGCYDCTDPA